MVDLHREAPRLHRVLFEEAPHPPELLRELRDLEAVAVDSLQRWLSCLDEVQVPDVRLAARFVATVGEAVAHRLVIHPDASADPDRYAEEAVRLLSGYLRGGVGPRRPDRP
jgi:hypothetical protein